MDNKDLSSFFKQFFYEVYGILKNTDKKVIELYFEKEEIEFLKDFNRYELKDFLDNFNFITIKRGKYGTIYISINKVLFVLECINILNLDLKEASKLLDFAGFEALIKEILLRNNYKVISNFRFSDKSCSYKKNPTQTRYEIDVIGLNKKKILVIDAKHWYRRDSYSSLNKAANLQYQRVKALNRNPEIVSKMIHKLLGINPILKNHLPLKLLPIIVTLEDNSCKLNEKEIPLVSIYNFNSFLQELEKYLKLFKSVNIKSVNVQKKLN